MATTSQAKFTQRALAHLEDKFLQCRDPSTKHKWEILNDYHVVPAATAGRKVTHVARDFICERCSTKDSPTVKREKYILVNRNGVERLERVGAPVIDYTEGYLIPGVPRGVKPAEIVRAEQYRRSLERAVGAAKGQRAAAER